MRTLNALNSACECLQSLLSLRIGPLGRSCRRHSGYIASVAAYVSGRRGCWNGAPDLAIVAWSWSGEWTWMEPRYEMLGWPSGSISYRLARGRELRRLRAR